ncbi:MAG TPA: hypothetical protein VK996_17560 [Ramlibacter sp.]|nr:hypothetical protein [Ramlibacter sp.]
MTVRRSVIWLVLLALLTAQALGLVHRVMHGWQPAAVMSMAAHDEAPAAEHDHDRWATGLTHGHADDPICLVFDQVTQGGALFALPAIVLPAVAPLLFLRWFQGEALARWAALFEARGPPPLR